jgi:hypothetical protein
MEHLYHELKTTYVSMANYQYKWGMQLPKMKFLMALTHKQWRDLCTAYTKKGAAEVAFQFGQIFPGGTPMKIWKSPHSSLNWCTSQITFATAACV